MNILGFTTSDIFSLCGIAFTLASVVSAIMGRRSLVASKAAVSLIAQVKSILGHPNPDDDRPSTGSTITEKVEVLGQNDMMFLYNQKLIAETLRQISDDVSQIRGTGRRRLPTDSIQIPEGFPNGE